MKRFSISEIVSFYQSKYGSSSAFLLIKSLAYFEDAEGEPDPIVLNGTTWNQVKNNVINATNSLL